MKEIFNIEYQYQKYLKLVKLKESDMKPIQINQLRQTFFAACGMMLILLRDDIGAMEENEAITAMENMISQVSNHFIKPDYKHN